MQTSCVLHTLKLQSYMRVHSVRSCCYTMSLFSTPATPRLPAAMAAASCPRRSSWTTSWSDWALMSWSTAWKHGSTMSDGKSRVRSHAHYIRSCLMHSRSSSGSNSSPASSTMRRAPSMLSLSSSKAPSASSAPVCPLAVNPRLSAEASNTRASRSAAKQRCCQSHHHKGKPRSTRRTCVVRKGVHRLRT